MNLNLILCLIGCVLCLVGGIRGIKESAKKTKTYEQKENGIEAPRQNETKIEHEVTEENGGRKEFWYVYTYVATPGWFLRSAHKSAGEAIWQKKWSDDLHFKKTTVILKETLP